jgi:hypothetical protein
MEEMGMTDKQFNAFLRLLIEDLKEVEKETESEKVKKIIENLQKTLED